LKIQNLRFVAVTNDPNMDGNMNKHYITIFMAADVSADSPELENAEPHKCEGWEWTSWDRLTEQYAAGKELLFDPLQHLIEQTGRTRPAELMP
jgi:8-oxo-dGTP diphosphatase